MKIKIEFEGDHIEDRDVINPIINALDMCSAIFDAKQIIRSRLKYGENVTEIEEQTLENISAALILKFED